MPASLAVEPDAQADADAAGDYYEAQRPGLGDDFATVLADCLLAICASPTRWPLWRAGVRRVKLAKFPHYVYYRYDAATDRVTVHTVFHPSRDPADLARRLGPP